MDIGEEIAQSSVRGSIYLFLGTTSSTILLALASIVFGRLLGPEGYGLYALSLTPSALLIIGTGYGLNVGLVKYLSEYQRRGEYGWIKSIIWRSISFQALCGSILAAILYLYPDIFARYLINRPEAIEYIRITSLYVVGMVVLATLNQIFIGLNRMGRTSITMFIQASSKLAVGAGLVILGFGIYGAVLGHSISYIIGGAAGAILIYLLIRSYKGGSNPSNNIGLLKLISYGFPVYIGAVTMPFLNVYRNYLLSIYTSNVEIGYFTAAINLAAPLVIFINPVVSTLFSSFSRLEKEREMNIIRQLFRYSIKYSSTIITPIIIYVFVTSREIITLVYGSAYSPASPYLILAAAPYLLVASGYLIINSLLNGIGETGMVMRILLIAAATSIPLYPILLITLGITGILITMFVAALAGLVYGLRYAHKKYGLQPEIRGSIKIVLAAALAGLITLAVKYVLQVARPIYAVTLYGFIYLLAYMVVLPYIGGLKAGEMDMLEKSFKGLGILGYLLTLLIRLGKKLCKK